MRKRILEPAGGLDSFPDIGEHYPDLDSFKSEAVFSRDAGGVGVDGIVSAQRGESHAGMAPGKRGSIQAPFPPSIGIYRYSRTCWSYFIQRLCGLGLSNNKLRNSHNTKSLEMRGSSKKLHVRATSIETKNISQQGTTKHHD